MITTTVPTASNTFADDVELFLEEISQSPRPSTSELNSIYYVTGAMIHSQLRVKPCSSCSDVLLSDSADVVIIGPDTFDSPCDEACKLFSLCQQCYCIFNCIRSDPSLEQKFLAVDEKKHFFVRLVTILLVDIWPNYTSSFKCSMGHDIINSMIDKFFNCFMSNYVRDLSQNTRPTTSRRKVQKLCGEF